MLRNSAVVCLILYSLFYAIRADLVFTTYDTRYACTNWIKDNIEKGSSIGIIQEPELLFASNLIDSYKIYYVGEEIKYDNNPYRKIRAKRMSEEDMSRLNSKHDYIIVSTWDYMKYEYGTKIYIEKNYTNRKDYDLVKEIQYNENLLFNPRPSYTCPTIFIFKKNR